MFFTAVGVVIASTTGYIAFRFFLSTQTKKKLLLYVNEQGLFPVMYWVYTTRIGYHLHKKSFATPRTPHSTVDNVYNKSGVMVRILAMLGDNYCYVIVDTATHQAAAVDPGDPHALLQWLSENDEVKLTHLLITHKHWDHAGGVYVLKEKHPELVVVGRLGENVPMSSHSIRQNSEVFSVGNLEFRSFDTPCHTRHHVIFSCPQASALFTGDTFFSGGVGKFFEGDAAQMYRNVELINTFPSDTQIFGGHEYTLDNLVFSCWLEPANMAAMEMLKFCQTRRKDGVCTVPTTLASERQYNPFLRYKEMSVVESVEEKRKAHNLPSLEQYGESPNPIQTLAAMRLLKDRALHKQ